ncbi:hypothetical protein ACFS27_11680 [Promicromonospora vindobonensis]|uniref:Uncharacterized protein n=1 Tax=Promicromonospora vindobonensis TaxID=195748 RepID=A0ABW5VRB1_9MICO
MSMWGPAVEAEIEYRQAEVEKAWGGRRASGADRFIRARRRSEQRSERRAEREARPDRAEQIREGIAGMRPVATTTRRGLFA